MNKAKIETKGNIIIINNFQAKRAMVQKIVGNKLK